MGGRADRRPKRTAAHAPDNGAGGTRTGWARMVGRSAALQRVRELGQAVARGPATVLVTGESGTGKEVVARAIHESSPRAAGPLSVVDCAAIPEHLFEAELFGHEPGAFTGAAQGRRGRFEESHGGTLLLDEVTAFSNTQQAKLLRVLQERSIRRLGGSATIELDFRIVAITSHDLRQAVRDGRLREDLYYRLHVVEIAVPPLRDRRDDLPDLALHFLESHPHGPLRRVSAAAVEAMQAYAWPGNVRELQNAVQRAAVLAAPDDGDALLPRHLPDEVRGVAASHAAAAEPGAPLDLTAAMRRVRFACLVEALHLARGNRSEAARLLGISRRAVYDLLDEFPQAGRPAAQAQAR
jgi:DNA-binding NtrC family response regulator